MFKNQMKKYPLSHPVVTKNELNEDVITYEYDRDIDMAIAINRQPYNGNDTSVLNAELTGITKYKFIKRGDKIGDMIVSFVEVNRMYTFVYLKEVNHNGRHAN